MVRRDKQRGIVDIEHTNGMMQTTDRWLVVKKLLDKASEVSCACMSCTLHTCTTSLVLFMQPWNLVSALHNNIIIICALVINN